MAESLDLLDKNVILTILSEVTRSEEKCRRKDAFNAYQIMRGNIDPYVKRELIRTRPKSHKGYTVSDISLSGLITNKRAQAYDEEPIRSIDGNDIKTQNLEDIYDESDADDQLEFFDTLFNLNRYGLMWINYLETKKRFQLIALQPYEAVIVRDKDDGELLIVGLNYPDREITQESQAGDGISNLIAESQGDSSATGRSWVFWSKDKHVKIVEKTQVVIDDTGQSKLKPDVDYMEIEGNPNNINPLKVLPFVFKSTEASPDYPVTNPLTSQTIKFNTQQSETMTSKNIHGTGIQTFSYPESQQGKFEKMDFGQLSAVELPQLEEDGAPATTFEYKTSGAQLTPMMEIDKSYVEQIANQHGLENFEIDKGSVTAMNGISRAIAGASVQKIISKNQKKYVKLEKDIFEILKAWDIYNGTKLFSVEDQLQIVFPKPKVLISDRETLDNIKLALEIGAIEDYEKLIKLDPNLSVKEAKDKLKRINKSRIENASNFFDKENDADQSE